MTDPVELAMRQPAERYRLRSISPFGLSVVSVAKKGYEDKYSPTVLRTIHDWIVKRQLALTEGVVQVNAFGGKIKQYE